MDQTFTQPDINTLAGKLDEWDSVLTSKESELLLATFILAGTAIRDRVDGASSASRKQTEGAGGLAHSIAPDSGASVLSDGFKDAFQAIGRGYINLRNEANLAASSVGIGGIW